MNTGTNKMKSVDTEWNEESRTHIMEFDAVLVVTGAMAKPNIPHLPGK